MMVKMMKMSTMMIPWDNASRRRHHYSCLHRNLNGYLYLEEIVNAHVTT